MTAPSPARDDATLRGAVVLVVAIVIGLALLARGGSAGDDGADGTPSSPTEAEATEEQSGSTDTLAPIDSGSGSGSEPSSPDDTRPPAEVVAIVLNGTTADVVGAAGANNDKLVAGNYQTLEPGNANADLATTTIYARPEFQADAEAVRGLLDLPDASIEVKPEEALGPGAEEADIVVVVGDDVAG